jgi:hypothetical protein
MLDQGYAANMCEEQDAEPVALIAQTKSPPDVLLIVDSGSFPGFTSDVGHLNGSIPVAGKMAKMANGGSMTISHHGLMTLFPNLNDVTMAVSPSTHRPLLSVADACSTCNVTAVFEADRVVFVKGKIALDDSMIVGVGHKSGNMYVYNPARDCNPSHALASEVVVCPPQNSMTEPLSKPMTECVPPDIECDTPVAVYAVPQPADERLSLLEQEVFKLKEMRKAKRAKKRQNQNVDKSIDNLKYIWHERCAHLSALSRTVANQAASGLPKDLAELEGDSNLCTHCLAGKQQQRSYPTHAREHVNWKPGESYHIDIDVINHPSLGGANYAFTCTDRCTNRIFSFPLKAKSEAGARFKFLIAYSERMTGNKLREVVCDNAREFIEPGSDLGEFLNINGITPSTSTPYIHDENPYAENANKIIAGAARTIRIRAHLPKYFWAEAYRFASTIHSMLVPNGRTITPFEAFERRKPDFSDIHIFGCHCYAWVPRDLRHKLDSKSRPAIYLGPSVPGKHGHRLYDPSTGEIFTASSVVFDELSFGIPELMEIIKIWRGDQSLQIDQRFSKPQTTMPRQIAIEQAPPPITSADTIKPVSAVPMTPKLERKVTFATPLGAVKTPEKDPHIDPFTQPLSPEPLEGIEDVILEPVPTVADVQGAKSNSRETPMIIKRARVRRDIKLPPKYTSDANLCHTALICNAIIPDENLCEAKISQVENIIEATTPRNYREAIAGEKREEWRLSMQREWDAHKSNKTWTLVPRPPFVPEKTRSWQGINPTNGKKVYVLPGVWRYRIKTAENGEVTSLKSRWCADGSGISVENEHTFVSIARPATIRLVAALAAIHNATLSSGDVPSAYVKSKIPDDIEVYLQQPPGFLDDSQPSHLCILSKALYGLPFAGQCWNRDLSEFLVSIGFVQSTVDPGVFRITRGNDFMVIASIVDDDIKFSTSTDLKNEVVAKLKAKFDYKDVPIATWFLGMRITQSNESIAFDQQDYCKAILSSVEQPVRNSDSPALQHTVLSDDDSPTVTNFPYSSICGKLRYLTITRPDIEFALNQCCRFQSNPKETHVEALKKILGYLQKHDNVPLTFAKSPNSSSLRISAFSDASHGDNIPSRRSSFGFLVLLNNNVISWTSRVTPCVATSTSEAEYIAISETAKEIIHIRNVLVSLKFEVAQPMTIWADSYAAISIATIERINGKTKHIDIRFHFVRELIKRGDITIRQIPSNQNLSDIFTKNVGPIILKKFIHDLLGHKFPP